MSTEYKLKAKREAAIARWEAEQMQAANAQRELDYAIAVFEQHKEELDSATIEATEAQIEAQKAQIKEYVMKALQSHNEALLSYEEQMRRLAKNA
jgi:hypothetical protein